MATAASALATILSRARQGWKAEQPEIAHGLLRRLCEKLRAEFEIIQVEDNALMFIADLSKIRLRGTNDAACLLVGGSAEEVGPAVRRFWDSASGPEQLIIIFALTAGAVQAAEKTIPPGFACVLNPEAVGALLDSSNTVEDMKQTLRRQIPLRRLIPFTIKHSVRGNMFYGRRSELQQLIEENAENFVIAGQGRIGKSSLLDEYKRQLVLKKDPRLNAFFRIDFYTCQPKSEAAIARFLAKNIEGTTYRTENMSPEDLESFLRYHARERKHKLDLVLDEVDLVCGSKTFKNLAHISKNRRGPIARLILAGRRELLRQANSEESPLKEHAWLMRLEPLDEDSARKLLIEPLGDMGIAFADDKTLVERILRLTGRLPQLIQYFGAKLARLMCAEDLEVITGDHIESIRVSEETTNLFMSPVREVSDPLAEFIALLLIERNIHEVDASLVKDLAGMAEIRIDGDWASRLCDDLLLSNFLAWTKTGYQIANQATALRARETGYLAPALNAARQQVKARFFV